jgi:hypothetical protein
MHLSWNHFQGALFFFQFVQNCIFQLKFMNLVIIFASVYYVHDVYFKLCNPVKRLPTDILPSYSSFQYSTRSSNSEKKKLTRQRSPVRRKLAYEADYSKTRLSHSHSYFEMQNCWLCESTCVDLSSFFLFWCRPEWKKCCRGLHKHIMSFC